MWPAKGPVLWLTGLLLDRTECALLPAGSRALRLLQGELCKVRGGEVRGGEGVGLCVCLLACRDDEVCESRDLGMKVCECQAGGVSVCVFICMCVREGAQSKDSCTSHEFGYLTVTKWKAAAKYIHRSLY